jgi:5'-deoxynucleotidase YfbR-like HD superfamily hydrolase
MSIGRVTYNNRNSASKEVLDSFSFMHGLNAVKRYSRDEMRTTENVLEHTGWVVSYALILALKLQNAVAGVTINYETLLRRATVHDWDEVGTGDIPRITKYASKAALTAFKALEESSVSTMEDYLSLKKGDLHASWITAKDYTIEGQIVKVADIAAVAYRVWYEIARSSNLSFLRVGLEAQDAMKSIKIDTSLSPNSELAQEFLQTHLTVLRELMITVTSRPDVDLVHPIDISLIVED